MGFVRFLFVIAVLIGLVGAFFFWFDIGDSMPFAEPAFDSNQDNSAGNASIHSEKIFAETRVEGHQSTGLGGGDGQDPEIQRLRRDVSLLRHDMDTLTQKLDSLTETLTRVSMENSEPFDVSIHEEFDVSNDEYVAQLEEQDNQFLDVIATDFENERVDPQWADQAINHIELALSNEQLAQTAVIDIDCRSTLCRLEVEHDDAQAITLFQSLFTQPVNNSSLQPTTIKTINSEEGQSTVVYLSATDSSLLEKN